VSSDGTTLEQARLGRRLVEGDEFQAAAQASEMRRFVAGLELRTNQGQRIALERDRILAFLHGSSSH